jgi:hypothetical protein
MNILKDPKYRVNITNNGPSHMIKVDRMHRGTGIFVIKILIDYFLHHFFKKSFVLFLIKYVKFNLERMVTLGVLGINGTNSLDKN